LLDIFILILSVSVSVSLILTCAILVSPHRPDVQSRRRRMFWAAPNIYTHPYPRTREIIDRDVERDSGEI
jgi:hypothetical protein